MQFRLSRPLLAKGHVVKRWIFNPTINKAELVDGVRRAINPLRSEGYYFELDRDGWRLNYESTYDTERECLEAMAQRFERFAEEHQACMETAKADRNDCKARAREFRKRIEALP